MTEQEFVTMFMEQHPFVGEYFLEVPAFARSIDLVIKNATEIEAIEFKMHNVSQAIKQAKVVAITFDYCSICMPCPKTNKGILSIVKRCNQAGIGLVLHDTTFKRILNPTKNKYWETARLSVLNNLERD
jgi:hypothetical protein